MTTRLLKPGLTKDDIKWIKESEDYKEELKYEIVSPNNGEEYYLIIEEENEGEDPTLNSVPYLENIKERKDKTSFVVKETTTLTTWDIERQYINEEKTSSIRNTNYRTESTSENILGTSLDFSNNELTLTIE